ncbi:hypothetical protein HELRODRAFT_90638 [Helobdella robusta]|uniref:5'-nucleotidase n=1 Tax=Helobdella robusta TaxID=6412 RepID=T1G7T7_HELRO|nr:hypothetical protein HELRODRAFT_90638 [Helobdella robusta]ESN90934.1 hypothetical protein HELRODRAFT_90638 [Helobdella robusta]
MFRVLILNFFFDGMFAQTSSLSMTILHTNDVHARVEPFTAMGAKCPEDGIQECFGGVSKRASFIKQERAKGELLLLDAGDQFQGSPWFYIYKGEDSSHFMNELNYTAMSLGNHEFDNGVEGLRNFLKNVTFTVLCSNLEKSSAPDYLESIKPFTVVNYKGKNITIIGYLTDKVPELSKIGNLKFTNEVSKVKELVQAAVSSGAKYIIAVGHAGYQNDLKMAQEVPDLDIIVGGHSHTLLHNAVKKFKDKITDGYPKVVEHGNGKKTLVVQTGFMGKFVGKLTVQFDEAGNVVSFEGNTVLMDKSIPSDAVIDAQLTSLNAKIKETFGRKIGETEDFLDGGQCRLKECNIGNLFTDAIISYFQEKWPNLVIGLVNGGSLRSSINKGCVVTYNDIVSTFPFSDPFVLADVKGVVLKEVFEHSVANYSTVDKHGKFMQMSGIKVLYDLKKPNDNRVVEIKVATKFKSQDYEPLKPEQTYKVALAKFVFNGGDGYTSFGKHSCTKIDVEILMKYFELNPKVRAVIEGRIRFVNHGGEFGDGTSTEEDKESGTVFENDTHNRNDTKNSGVGLTKAALDRNLLLYFIESCLFILLWL